MKRSFIILMFVLPLFSNAAVVSYGPSTQYGNYVLYPYDPVAASSTTFGEFSVHVLLDDADVDYFSSTIYTDLACTSVYAYDSYAARVGQLPQANITILSDPGYLGYSPIGCVHVDLYSSSSALIAGYDLPFDDLITFSAQDININVSTTTYYASYNDDANTYALYSFLILVSFISGFTLITWTLLRFMA